MGNLAFIEENMTGEMHKNTLDENSFQSSKNLKLDSGMVFQHDNVPKHRAHIVNHWLDGNHVERLIWPSFAPNLNPAEYPFGINSNVK